MKTITDGKIGMKQLCCSVGCIAANDDDAAEETALREEWIEVIFPCERWLFSRVPGRRICSRRNVQYTFCHESPWENNTRILRSII